MSEGLLDASTWYWQFKRELKVEKKEEKNNGRHQGKKGRLLWEVQHPVLSPRKYISTLECDGSILDPLPL
jgi:hypothetical protein